MKQAAKKKLISIPKTKIAKLSKAQLAKAIDKATYEKVYTDATWTALDAAFRKKK